MSELGPLFEEGVCIRCGGPVVQDNDWRMCSKCIRKTEKDRKEMIAARKSVDKRSPEVMTVRDKGMIYTFMKIPKERCY